MTYSLQPNPHAENDLRSVKAVPMRADTTKGMQSLIWPMAASPTSRPHAPAPRAAVVSRLVCAVAMLVLAGLAPATASAAPTPGVSPRATADVTDQTTGIADASSSVVPRDVCAAPGPGRAACLAQYLALRGTRTPIHPHLRPAASPYRFIHLREHRRGAPPLATAAAAPPPQAGTPAYLQQAYDLSYLSQTWGGDKTVAIVAAYDNPNAESDLAAYRSNFQLRPCTTANHCFRKIKMGTSPPPSDPRWSLEISLDLDAVSALCPNCQIILVEAASNLSSDLHSAQVKAASLNADVISDSFGAPLSDPPSKQDFFFGTPGEFSFPGIATVAASGDSGYPATCAPPSTPCNEYPAAQPDITAAGGTSLAPANGPRGFGESAWSGTGSGCNTNVAQPSWQANLNTGCPGHRGYNDISASADPATGMQVYDSTYNPGQSPWVVVGGTSEAAPLIAAYYALVESATDAAGPASPGWPYASASLLNDPATGSNALSGNACPALSVVCTGLPGYDGPTGAGSISGAVVTGAPGIGGPGTNGSYAQNVSMSSAQLQGGVYPNGDPTTYWWEYGTTTSYGQATAPQDIGSGTTPSQASTVLTGLQPNTTYHYRLVASNSFGEMDGYDFTFTTLPAPPPPTTTPTTPTTPTRPPSPPAPTKPAPAPRPSAPSLGGLRIGALGAGTATVSAAINPHGASTTFYLAYGTSPALGRVTPLGASARASNATWHLRGLAAGKIYYLQVVATNAGGTRRTATVRVKTSPVTLGRITMQAGKLAVRVRCHGSAACRVRLTAQAGTRVIASGTANVRGNRTRTVLLNVNRAAATRASHGGKLQAIMSAVSVWNGYRATVTAKFHVALRT
jgi:hypothetical protein